MIRMISKFEENEEKIAKNKAKKKKSRKNSD